MVAAAIEDEIVRTKVKVVSKNLVVAVPMCNWHRGCTHDFTIIELQTYRLVMWMGCGRGLPSHVLLQINTLAATVTQVHTWCVCRRDCFPATRSFCDRHRRIRTMYGCQAANPEKVG